MLTLITGTPGAGKTLLATWEQARPVPGSSIENDGVAVPRRLFSNIKNLIVEHQHITAKDLECWQTWAQPGDVILFDEVQEVWRPRGLGVKVPPEIAALETHRHMGVDLVLISQHPMLLDPNIRRLVNQHLHLRRITKGVAMVYEWDHCENPGSTKTCIATRLFFHKRKMYALYKSAQLHTKPKARLPAMAYVALALCGVLVYAGPMAYERVTANFKKPDAVKLAQAPISAPLGSLDKQATQGGGLPPRSPATPDQSTAQVTRPLGCITFKGRCQCFGADGAMVKAEYESCLEGSHRTGFVLAGTVNASPPVPFVSQADAVATVAETRGSPAAVGSPIPRPTRETPRAARF